MEETVSLFVNQDVIADQDKIAKDALWQAITILVSENQEEKGLSVHLGHAGSARITTSTPRPESAFWKLVEVLSLLVVLKKADEVRSRNVYNILGKIPKPVEYRIANDPFFLWNQRSMAHSLSGFSGIPDLTITTTDAAPNRSNVLEIIEVKSGKLSSRLIRQEFAKGFDLNVDTYVIWSYQQPTINQINGAQLLGIDLEPLGFDVASGDRATRLNPRNLIDHFSVVLDSRRKFQRFGNMLTESANVVRDKRLRRLT